MGFAAPVYPWLRAHELGGETSLQSHVSTGRPPTLTHRQKEQVRRWICGKDPRQHGFDFALWTRRIVADLVERKFNKVVGVTFLGRLLAELEITPQKLLRRAYGVRRATVTNSPASENDGVRDIKVLAKPYTREQRAHAVREAPHGYATSLGGIVGADVRGEPSIVIPLCRPRRRR
jgi:transposase